MIAVRQPTKPLRGLAATFKITRAAQCTLYNCRFCGARFELTPLNLRDVTRAERDMIYAHAFLHEMVGQ